MGENIHCSFCGKSNEEVSKIVAGDDVYICNGCVYICVGILVEAINPLKDKPSADLLDNKGG